MLFVYLFLSLFMLFMLHHSIVLHVFFHYLCYLGLYFHLFLMVFSGNMENLEFPGPLNDAVLNLQHKHRSGLIWQGQDTGRIKCRSHMLGASKFMVCDEVEN